MLIILTCPPFAFSGLFAPSVTSLLKTHLMNSGTLLILYASTEKTYSLHFVKRCGKSWASLSWTSLAAQMVKSPPAMQETQVRSLGQQDPLEKGMATHFSILAWRIPWTEEPGRAVVHGVAKSRT